MLRDTFFTKTSPTESETVEDITTDEVMELPVDLVRSGDNLIVRAPMVGIDINLVSVTIGNNHLTVRKDTSPQPVDPADRVYLQECHWGELARTIDLPLPINPDRTRATLHDGVLTVIMPILNPHHAKLIRVRGKL